MDIKFIEVTRVRVAMQQAHYVAPLPTVTVTTVERSFLVYLKLSGSAY